MRPAPAARSDSCGGWRSRVGPRPAPDIRFYRNDSFSIGGMRAGLEGRLRRIRYGGGDLAGRAAAPAGEPMREAVEIEVDDRRGVEGEPLRHEQAADNGDAERAAQLGAGALADGERQAAADRGEGRHHDRPEAQQAGFVERLERAPAVLALGLEREVDHHDGVLLDDADQQDDADQSDDAEIVM